jgi:hypothetical protein
MERALLLWVDAVPWRATPLFLRAPESSRLLFDGGRPALGVMMEPVGGAAKSDISASAISYVVTVSLTFMSLRKLGHRPRPKLRTLTLIA